MSLASCVYEGVVRHRRLTPRAHAFEMPVYMMYLDLSEMDRVFAGHPAYSTRRPAPVRFRRSDYLGDASVPLDAAVRDAVAAETGARPEGPVRLLTHLRHFGYCFNPVSFYYCFDRDGERVVSIAAQITNTPWKERHTYVMTPDVSADVRRPMRFSFEKAFHVSPFMPMTQRYDWAFGTPGDRLAVRMRNSPLDRAATEPAAPRDRAFDAVLSLRRLELTRASLTRVLWRYPMLTSKVVGRIHYEALRLWLKRVPVHAHPRKKEVGRA